MLANIKWSLLTIVIVSIIITNAIERPIQILRANSRSTARNLLKPYQIFNKIDEFNVSNLVPRADGSAVDSFNAYRRGGRQLQRNLGNAQRRSDGNGDAMPKITKPNYIYIPLQQNQTQSNYYVNNFKKNASLSHFAPPNAPEATELVSEYENNDRADQLIATGKFDNSEQTTSRRSGFQFPSYSLTPVSTFQPQAYREDSALYSDLSPTAFETKDDIVPTIYGPDAIPFSTQQFDYPPVTLNSAVAAGKLYREEVTKFGDINGPITALPQRVHNPGNGFFQNEPDIVRGLSTRFNEFIGGDYSGSRKSRFYRYKSSRSPRVVFPNNDNIGTSGVGNTGAGNIYLNDNVAFRDQNFGINDLAAIQDVRNDFNVQDFDNTDELATTTASTFKEKGDNLDLECQHRGGNCEFFLGCWMTGGLLQGACPGLLRGCCHRTAKSANLRTSDAIGHTIDLTDLPLKNYGPVKNDASESKFGTVLAGFTWFII